MVSSSLWLLAALTCGGSHFAASVTLSSEKAPVRRTAPKETDLVSPKELDSIGSDEDKKVFSGASDDMICIVWGDARPAGHQAGTTKMNAQHFATLAEADEHMNKAKLRGADIIVEYHGNRESRRFLTTRMTNVIRWRSLFEWCSRHDELQAPEKFRMTSFVLKPVSASVRKDKGHAGPTTFSLKQRQQLASNDEDEGPATAYLEEQDNMHCIISADTKVKGETLLSATLFDKLDDANQNFKLTRSHGSSLVVQYKGKREYKRHVAPVLKHVPWASLLDWCRQVHAARKAAPKGSYFTNNNKGRPDQRVLGSFIDEAPVSAPVDPAQFQEGVSMAEAAVTTAEAALAYRISDFATTSSYDHVQELMGHGMRRQVLSYQRVIGWNCHLENSTDAHMIGVDMSASACKEYCDKDLQCSCLQYDRTNGACYTSRLAHCNEKKCTSSKSTSIYLQKAQWAIDTTNVQKFQGKACAVTVSGNMIGRGGKVRATEQKVTAVNQCRETCASDVGCTCFKYDHANLACTTMSNCKMDDCEDSKNEDMYMHTAVHNGYASTNDGKPW